ncbi:MAG: DNA repair protein RecO, partial [Planctomycetota bacterium]
MSLIRDQAIVLRRLDYSETSQVLVLMARRYGKVRAIAKGVKRSTKTRFAVGIDLLEQGEVVLSVRTAGQQELATLTAWKQGPSFWGLRRKLVRLYAAQYAAEVTAGLTADWDPHVGLYDALAELLERLCSLEDPLPPVVVFLTQLLKEVGLAPRLSLCVGCGKPAVVGAGLYFSSAEGGLLCRDCEGSYVEKRQVAAGALTFLGSLPESQSDVSSSQVRTHTPQSAIHNPQSA